MWLMLVILGLLYLREEKVLVADMHNIYLVRLTADRVFIVVTYNLRASWNHNLETINKFISR